MTWGDGDITCMQMSSIHGQILTIPNLSSKNYNKLPFSSDICQWDTTDVSVACANSAFLPSECPSSVCVSVRGYVCAQTVVISLYM